MKTFLKFLLTSAILGWLIHSGKLDLKSTELLLKDWRLFVATISVWVFAALILTSLRWKEILKSIGVDCSFVKVVRLNLVGLFFNVAMPGSVGGDFVKAYLVTKDHTDVSKTRVFSTVLVDRILGLMALMLIGFVTCVGLYLNESSLEGIEWMMALTGTISICFFIGVGILFKSSDSIFNMIHRFFERDIVGFSIARKLIDVFRDYSQQSGMVVRAFLLSLGVQGATFVYFVLVVSRLLPEAPLSVVANVPVALLVTAIPISLGGLGVGHFAFERLFLVSGVVGGANVYNMYFVGYFILNLLGAIPYVLHFKKADIPTSETLVSDS